MGHLGLSMPGNLSHPGLHRGPGLPCGAEAEISSLTADCHYTFSVVESLQAFSTMALAWDSLLQRCGIANISLYHSWLSLWLEIFSPRGAFIIVVRDEAGELVAAAPFFISRNASGLACRLLRRVQFIGTAPEVYDAMRIIIHPQANAGLALAQIAHALRCHQDRWDVLDWRYMDDAVQLHHLLEGLQPVLHHSEITQPMSIPYIDLPEVWDTPPPYRKKKYQSDLNRIRNHLNRDFGEPQPRLVIHPPGPQGDAIVSTFLKTHQAYWLAKGCRSEYDRHRQLMGFYQGIYQRFNGNPANGSLSTPIFELSTLELGGDPVSYHFDIQTPKGCMGYLSCYQPQAKKYRPGHLHIEALIERTHLRGGRCFELGRGDESYKNQWNIERKPLWNLLAFGNGFSRKLWRFDTQLKVSHRFKRSQESERTNT